MTSTDTHKRLQIHTIHVTSMCMSQNVKKVDTPPWCKNALVSASPSLCTLVGSGSTNCKVELPQIHSTAICSLLLHEYGCQSSQECEGQLLKRLKISLWSNQTKSQNKQTKTTTTKTKTTKDQKTKKHSTKQTKTRNLIDLSEVFSPCTWITSVWNAARRGWIAKEAAPAWHNS